MSAPTESPAPRAWIATAVGVARLRRGSFAVLMLVLAEYVMGMYVNLYVTVPKTDHGSDLGGQISTGPAWLSVHAVIGLLLAVGAVGVLAQAVLIRHWGVTALVAAGLLAVVFAAVAGTGFTSTGDTSASMAMAVLTAVALGCYAASLYVLRSASRR
jgi:hypothetical protein